MPLCVRTDCAGISNIRPLTRVDVYRCADGYRVSSSEAMRGGEDVWGGGGGQGGGGKGGS